MQYGIAVLHSNIHYILKEKIYVLRLTAICNSDKTFYETHPCIFCDMLIANDLCDNIKLYAREKSLYDCVQTAKRKIILMDCDAGYTI